jgi:hypothetical protein
LTAAGPRQSSSLVRAHSGLILTHLTQNMLLAGSDETVRSRKLLEGSPMGLFDGLKAVNKATKVVESHVSLLKACCGG